MWSGGCGIPHRCRAFTVEAVFDRKRGRELSDTFDSEDQDVVLLRDV